MIDSVVESLKETVPETDVEPYATTFVAQENLENVAVSETPEDVPIPDNKKSPD
ncbi:hypothetical protein A2U01_0073482, partial [Trifolium medium]|nr:hypothetical protein [Trifolium medium]